MSTASTPFSAFLIVATGTGINAVRNMQKGQNAFPTMLAGIVFGTICVGVNDVTKTDVGTGLALVFLLSSFLTNGVAFIDTVTQAIESY